MTKCIIKATIQELQQVIGATAHNISVYSVLGTKKQVKKEKELHDMAWKRLKKLNVLPASTQKINDDELLAELFS